MQLNFSFAVLISENYLPHYRYMFVQTNHLWCCWSIFPLLLRCLLLVSKEHFLYIHNELSPAQATVYITPQTPIMHFGNIYKHQHSKAHNLKSDNIQYTIISDLLVMTALKLFIVLCYLSWNHQGLLLVAHKFFLSPATLLSLLSPGHRADLFLCRLHPWTQQ